jgi:hypothetical protein
MEVDERGMEFAGGGCGRLTSPHGGRVVEGREGGSLKKKKKRGRRVW